MRAKVQNRFNSEAEALLAQLAEVPPNKRRSRLPASLAARRVAGTIEVGPTQARRVGPVTSSLAGKLTLVRIPANDTAWELTQPGISALERLASWISEHRELPSGCGFEYCRTQLLVWLEDRHLGRTSENLMDRLYKRLAEDARDRVYWFPVEGISMDSAFSFGGVRLDFISRDDASNTTAAVLAKLAPAEREGLSAFIADIEKGYPGRVVAIVEAHGTRPFALDHAAELCDAALDCLRFFHPYAPEPGERVFIGRPGTLVGDRFEYGSFGPDRLFWPESKSMPPQRMPLKFGPPQLQYVMSELQGARLDEWLRTGPANRVQASVLAGIRMFSRGLNASSLTDRILFAVVAAEQVFAGRNQPELKATLCRRVAAFLAEAGNADHDEVHAGLLFIYKVRSRFVHEGKPVNSMQADAIRVGLLAIWSALIQCLSLRPHVDTRRRFHAALDQLSSKRSQPDG